MGHFQGDGSTGVGTQMLVHGGAEDSWQDIKDDDEGVRPAGSSLQVLRAGWREGEGRQPEPQWGKKSTARMGGVWL